jgi:hypothetical protein
MKTKMFLNLPVKDLNRSIAFFTELGFSFNPKFTSEKATCLIIGENINVMLLVEEFYKTFIDKEICNTATANEAIISISVATREQVDEMIKKVVKAGESEYKETKDYGWMYQRNFRDIDGHHWEIFYMDESQMPQMC